MIYNIWLGMAEPQPIKLDLPLQNLAKSTLGFCIESAL